MFWCSNKLDAGYTFPCSATLPPLTLGLGVYQAVVPGEYLNYARVQDISTSSTPVSPLICYGALQPQTGMEFSIYGDVFIKSQFVVFDNSDIGAPRVGFAAKNLS